jgi:hypothetical protein
VEATAPSSGFVSRGLGVVVDIEKLSFYTGGKYIVVEAGERSARSVGA